MLYNKDMIEANDAPHLPLKDVKPVEYHTHPDSGDTVDRVTVMFDDSEGRTFSMVIRTAGDLIREAGGEAQDAEDDEPSFILPGNHVEPSDVETVLGGLAPSVLAKFAIEQAG